MLVLSARLDPNIATWIVADAEGTRERDEDSGVITDCDCSIDSERDGGGGNCASDLGTKSDSETYDRAIDGWKGACDRSVENITAVAGSGSSQVRESQLFILWIFESRKVQGNCRVGTKASWSSSGQINLQKSLPPRW